MARSRTAFRTAARDVDPMSWFTGPYVPLVFAGVIAVFGSVLSFTTWRSVLVVEIQLIALALCVAACLIVQLLTSLPARIDDALGFVVVGVGGAGVIVSALGYADVPFRIEQWWAPICFALAMASIVPYLAPWRILAFGALATVTVVPITFVIVHEHALMWGPVSVLVFVATPTLVSTAAGTAFAYSIVQQVLPIVDNRSGSVVSEHLDPDPEDEEAERRALARFTARAVPFLRGIAERGTVDANDRALAGEIARYLRDDLVSRSDLVWLGLRADDRRVVVIDPDRRAATLRTAQRTAVRDLVRAVLDDPATDATTMLIELRAESDGSTAVAMTLDTQLPEGRRVRHISPYYFNLRGEMRDVRLGRDGLRFRVPPRDAEE